jgi:hypothetical protein
VTAAAATLDEHAHQRGLSAGELVRRHRRPNTPLSAKGLTAWLVRSGPAVERGVLYATAKAFDIAGGIDWCLGESRTAEAAIVGRRGWRTTS